MRAIKVYCPPGVEPPLYAFIDALDGKLKAKLLWQIFRLRNLPACELKEPHFKHFSLERYSQMYELREKGKVLIRIVFTVQNEDVILLTSFIKRQPRDMVLNTIMAGAMQRTTSGRHYPMECPAIQVSDVWKRFDFLAW